MNELMIARTIRCHPLLDEHFAGTYASNELLPVIDNITLYIINMSPRSAPGSHWISIYRDARRKIIYYFDSYAMPYYYNLDIFKNMNIISVGFRIVTMPYRIQGMSSSLCGPYCILFLYYMFTYNNFKSFICIFRKNDFIYNDHLTCTYIQTRYPFLYNICNV